MLHDKPVAGQLGNALFWTRSIRFALEVMWEAADNLPDEAQSTDDSARAALHTLNGWLTRIEAGELRDMHIAREYAIVRPVSFLNPPSTAAMADITAALGVLRQHDLIITVRDA
jgi:hypothetical protein